MTEKRSPVRSRWPELPTELLELIMRKLGSVDILRFEAVCSCWYKAAKSYISAPYFALDIPQTPWLMIPGGEENPNVHTRRFFNLAEFKYYTIKNVFGDFPDAWCVGSSHGWLVLVEQKGTAWLFNPFSRDRIELPSIGTLAPKMSRNFINKVVTSSKPPSSSSSSSKEFAVVINYCDMPMNFWKSSLAFYKLGDEAWTGFGQKGQVYDRDCMFNSTNGQFFALACDGSVEVWDLRQCFPIIRHHLQPLTNEVNIDDIVLFSFQFSIKNYLVESLGELLLVKRFRKPTAFYKNDNPNYLGVGRPYRTCHFIIYRLKSSCKGFEWERVKSLHNRTLFLGGNHSVSLSTHNFPECEENSIYFTDDRWWDMKFLIGENGVGFGGHDLGVYKVKDNIVKPLPCYLRFDRWIINPPSFWIVPDIIPALQKKIQLVTDFRYGMILP